MDMHNDISKRTVLVLLVLTLVVSVVGTWTVLSMPKTVYKTVEVAEPPQGLVSVKLAAPTGPVPPVEDGGQVAVKILKS